MKKSSLFSCLLIAGLAISAQNNSIPHLQEQGTATQLIVNNKPFMRPIWKMLADKSLNTVIAPVSWELIEHLIVIWFASWKNSASTYMPSWVKKDTDKYPRVKDQSGKALNSNRDYSEAQG
ncbi:MAG: hypothetical protein NVSMB7_07380 [Chitinophagaceae bacterium]